LAYADIDLWLYVILAISPLQPACDLGSSGRADRQPLMESKRSGGVAMRANQEPDSLPKQIAVEKG